MVDDGGTDSSAAIAAAYAERDPRFKLVSQANRGLSGARNTGTRHATGEYLAFVDSDDVLPPNAYELLLGALEQTGSDFATGNVQRLTRWGTFQANFLVAHVHADGARDARDALPPAAGRPDRVEQALPPLVLGRAGLRVPRGPDPRGHPGDHPGAVRREVGRRDLRPRLLLADPRGRRPLDHAAAAGEQGAQRPHAGGRGGLGLPRGSTARAARSAGTRRASWPTTCGCTSTCSTAPTTTTGSCSSSASTPTSTARPRASTGRLAAIDRLKWHLVRRRLLPELLEVLRFQKEDLSDHAARAGAPPLVRRLPVPRRPAAEDPAPRSTGSSTPTCRAPCSSTSCASTTASC